MQWLAANPSSSPLLPRAVLLDLLQALPVARLVRLAPGGTLDQSCHLVLLAGSLAPASAAARDLAAPAEQLHAPGVVPWLSHTRFSFVAAAARQAAAWAAGPQGAMLLLCNGDEAGEAR